MQILNYEKDRQKIAQNIKCLANLLNHCLFWRTFNVSLHDFLINQFTKQQSRRHRNIFSEVIMWPWVSCEDSIIHSQATIHKYSRKYVLLKFQMLWKTISIAIIVFYYKQFFGNISLFPTSDHLTSSVVNLSEKQSFLKY